MKSIIYSAVSIAALLSATDLSAGLFSKKSSCPTLSAVQGSLEGDSAMIYTQGSSPGYLAKKIKGVKDKLRTTDEANTGVESKIKKGQITCDYTLPEKWVETSGLTTISLMQKITTAPTKDQLECIEIKAANMKAISGKKRLTSRKSGAEWLVVTGEGALTKAKNKASRAVFGRKNYGEDTVLGEVSDVETINFKHTCTYKLEDGTILVFNGEMKTP